MTHINFNNLDECIEFLQTDFNLQTIEIQNIEDFIIKSSQVHFEIDIKEDKSIQIKNLVLKI
ncbi:hypothetical protein CCYN49044_180057 [Capnocytophaga cynodegmi]|uniref:Uncharacterized protein n=1 Tax=Capnocytophaga cynodegmi TaxID=28189 RepID=A0A0B7HEL7_9FLAO|nr:hypothetical protein CCYN49044_180057 [Capnocytophaga cynodegmi]CEN38741.1 hypothetical protein CCYN74_30251 [Capnocytophaga cynodegmi]